jgi:hypothetical protein
MAAWARAILLDAAKRKIARPKTQPNQSAIENHQGAIHTEAPVRAKNRKKVIIVLIFADYRNNVILGGKCPKRSCSCTATLAKKYLYSIG